MDEKKNKNKKTLAKTKKDKTTETSKQSCIQKFLPLLHKEMRGLLAAPQFFRNMETSSLQMLSFAHF